LHTGGGNQVGESDHSPYRVDAGDGGGVVFIDGQPTPGIGFQPDRFQVERGRASGTAHAVHDHVADDLLPAFELYPDPVAYLVAEIVDVGLHHALEQPPFSSLEEAKRAFEGELFPYDYPEIHVGASVTDLLLRYRHDTPIDTYTYRSTFNPGLEGQENTANLVLDYFPGNVRVHRLTGLLNKPVQIRNSDWAAVSTFVRQGVVHILIGLDHVLFVLCLTAGAAGLVGLLWRVTGFTLGHTVTLILGFLGFVPSGEWFIPAVETAIALTIIYAAVIILLSGRRASDSVVSYAVTTGIGLVHGLGFSFVLHELLLPGGAHLWKSLISFNVGVEIGQVLIVAAVWAVLLGVARISRTALVTVHWAVALPCIALASFWTLERGLMLAEILFPPWAS